MTVPQVRRGEGYDPSPGGLEAYRNRRPAPASGDRFSARTARQLPPTKRPLGRRAVRERSDRMNAHAPSGAIFRTGLSDDVIAALATCWGWLKER